MFYPSETQVIPLTKVRRERLLPVLGEVLVSEGDKVEPTQVVARANLPGNFRILPVARALDVRDSKVESHLRVNLGDRVQQGQVIAKRGMLLGRSVKSPIDGIVTAIGGGRILIESQPVPFELRAYIRGNVTNVMQDRGVVVETTGAVVQGTWGTGDESVGVLNCVVRGPDRPLHARAINPSCHGAILIGGTRLDERGLERAQEVEVRGIVTGGLPPELISRVEDLPFPVVVTEGIGEVPMSESIFHLLETNEGREASISGHVEPHWGVVRPEVVVYLPAEEIPSTQTQPGTPLTVGTRVRITRAPHLGAVGTVVNIPDYARHIETGARVRCAEVDLGQEETVFVPLVNLEILR